MGRSLAWPPRSRARFLFRAPEPVAWVRIAQAIQEGWHVMLCWDAHIDVWRCDFIRRGMICTGEGDDIGFAADRAWAETVRALAQRNWRPRD